MPLASLESWLLQNVGFQSRFQQLLTESVSTQFPTLSGSTNGHHITHDWPYLLLCAGLLARSNRESAQDIALRIGQHCLQNPTASNLEKDAAAVILDTLANRPALRLAENRNHVSVEVHKRLPVPLRQDWVRRSIINSITLQNGAVLSVNHFQRDFWENIQVSDWLSLSAPTSAGKSYVIGKWIVEYLAQHPLATIVYLVPTRALLHQVEHDLREHLLETHLPNVSVSSFPLPNAIKDGMANVFVLTQERFHILLAGVEHNLVVDVLIIDEAHKIGDGARGVLLQQAIEYVMARNLHSKILFASPLAENPGTLLEDAPEGTTTTPLAREDITVNQNLIWVSQVRGQPLVWNVELCSGDELHRLGQMHLGNRPNPDSKRLPFLAYAMGSHEGGNIIYVNGQAEAEKTAYVLYDLIGDVNDSQPTQELSDLIELVRTVIHPEYSLAAVLGRGIAFHYGNMPLLIRTEVERLFKENKIKYLICTSTLVEGVNLPCKSIFVRGPTRGQGHPMDSTDFWNLAGRAGRWGREFEGNIVCIDARRADVWHGEAPRRRSRYRIKRTADVVLSRPEALLEFIANGAPRDIARTHQDLEYVFAYLVAAYLREGSIAKSPWARRFHTDLLRELDSHIERLCNGLTVPRAVIYRNPGISPLAMQALLDSFRSHQDAIEDVLPVPPESDAAVEVYKAVFDRIDRHFGHIFGPSTPRVMMCAIIVVNWMRGHQLVRIIGSRVNYLRRHNRPFELQDIIRTTMQNVEQIARFAAPKYLSCYVDVLRVRLEELGRADLSDELKDLSVWLEFGVSLTTQLSLMGLGLSRSTALELSALIVRDDLNEEECLQWIRRGNWRTAALSRLVKREIEELLRQRLQF